MEAIVVCLNVVFDATTQVRFMNYTRALPIDFLLTCRTCRKRNILALVLSVLQLQIKTINQVQQFL